MDDIVLIKRLQQGDAAAFPTLYENYQKQALRTACFLTGNQSTAEDVVQETFIKCYLQIRSLKDPASFRSWFFRILTRQAWSATAKDKKTTPVNDLFESMENETNGEDSSLYTLRKESHILLMDAVNSLDKKQKAVVVLYYYNTMSISEISKIVGCMEGTVKSRLYFARQKLYARLKKETDFIEKESELHESKTF